MCSPLQPANAVPQDIQERFILVDSDASNVQLVVVCLACVLSFLKWQLAAAEPAAWQLANHTVLSSTRLPMLLCHPVRYCISKVFHATESNARQHIHPNMHTLLFNWLMLLIIAAAHRLTHHTLHSHTAAPAVCMLLVCRCTCPASSWWQIATNKNGSGSSTRCSSRHRAEGLAFVAAIQQKAAQLRRHVYNSDVQASAPPAPWNNQCKNGRAIQRNC